MPSEIEDDDIKLAPFIGEAKFISKSFDNSTGVLSVKYTITFKGKTSAEKTATLKCLTEDQLFAKAEVTIALKNGIEPKYIPTSEIKESDIVLSSTLGNATYVSKEANDIEGILSIKYDLDIRGNVKNDLTIQYKTINLDQWLAEIKNKIIIKLNVDRTETIPSKVQKDDVVITTPTKYATISNKKLFPKTIKGLLLFLLMLL